MKPFVKGLLFIWLLGAAAASAQSFSAYGLRCEYMDEPLAVNTLTPKFSWKCASDSRGFLQTGYAILVGDSAEKVAAGEGNMWDTGKTESGNSLHIPYGGAPLSPGKQYWWSVRIWNPDGTPSPWSEPASFSVGLLSDADWDGAQWIAMEELPRGQRIVPGVEYKNLVLIGDRTPGTNKLPQFRREIEVKKPVNRAVAYVCGLGQFEFFINGAKVGDHFMDPPATDYDRLATYVPFDVTPLLQAGPNALGVMLGNGYVSIPRERYFKGLISYMYPKMIMKLAVEYEDGTAETFVSDKSWRTTESPVTYSSIFGGEDYDATRFIDGWMRPGFDDRKWQKVKIVPLEEGARLAAPDGYPMRLMQSFPPVSVRRTRHGKWLYDLGQNFQGTVQLTVSGKRGQAVRMNTSELFGFKVDSIPLAGGYRGEYRLTYTIGADDTPETWHPQFTYFGQRYVLVDGAVPRGEDNPDGLPVIEDITGLHIRNSMPSAGNFRCSDELLNKTNTLIEWGIKGNMAGFMTDCPHREKLPWIEQLHLMFGSLQYNFEMYGMYGKMLADMELAQWENGLVPDIAPMFFRFYSGQDYTTVNGFVDSPEWGSAVILSPWKVYEYYGDSSLIEKHYDCMKRYLEYLLSRADDYILSHGLGDWYDIGPANPGISQHTSIAATATPTFYMDTAAMEKCAELLGKTGDAAHFRELAANIKRSYNAKFYNAEGKYYDRNSQCANAIAVCAGLVEPENTGAVVENIVKDIRARGNALSAGDVGYNYVLRALESHGRSDVIYDMNSRYDVFGYGYQLAKGATALPETWDALPGKSNNHLMLGHLQEWFYSHVGGIRKDDNSLAYRSFTVRPSIVGGIKFARTNFESPYGTISTDWEDRPDAFEMRVEVPANTTAEIWVPACGGRVTESGVDAAKAPGLTFVSERGGCKIYEAGSGIYRFSAAR